jgi:small subunit ribosomal protein S16
VVGAGPNVWHNAGLTTGWSWTLSPCLAQSVRTALARCNPTRRPVPSTRTETGVAALVATKIKLMRLGKMREPHYRIVVADARTKRDGRSIETIGEYHPKNDPSVIKVDSERAAYWLGVGAQPTEAVAAILRVTGDWQRFKGEAAPEPMQMAAPKPDKQALFNAALAEVSGDPSAEATTPRKRAAKKADRPAETPADAPAETPAGATADTPAETPAETAAEVPAEVTAEVPTEPAADESAES